MKNKFLRCFMLFVRKQKNQNWVKNKLIKSIAYKEKFDAKTYKKLRIQNSLLVGSIALILSINLFASRLVNFWQTPLSSDVCQYWCPLVALRVARYCFTISSITPHRESLQPVLNFQPPSCPEKN